MALQYENISATSFQAVRKQLVETIFQGNPVFKIMHDTGKVESIDGGKWIESPIDYGFNTSFGAYAKYEKIAVAPTQELTMAQYPWRTYGGATQLAGVEEIQNSGASQMRSLWKQKVKTLAESAEQIMGKDMLASRIAADNVRGILSFEHIFDTRATQLGIGGIAPADTTIPAVLQSPQYATVTRWWECKRMYGANGTAGTMAAPIDYTALQGPQRIQRLLTRAIGLASEGTMKRPKYAITTRAVWEQANLEQIDANRYPAPMVKGLLDIGFDSIVINGMQLLHDPRVLTAANDNGTDAAEGGNGTDAADRHRLYLLNHDYVKFMMYSRRNFAPTTQFNQLGSGFDNTVQLLLWAGNLICSGRRWQTVCLLDNVPLA